MIPGTIEEWKKALKESKPGSERNVCVEALQHLGVALQRKQPGRDTFEDWVNRPDERFAEWRVKPTARPWNAEDAKRHLGYAFLSPHAEAVMIISPRHINPALRWHGYKFATPIPGTDPSTWEWKKCEVVE